MRWILDAVVRPRRAGAAAAVLLLCAPGVAWADPPSVAGGATSEVVVKRGDRGPAVRSVQRALGLPADGVFGKETERAVKRFQRRTGLVADGIVGPLTRRALGLGRFTRASVRSSRVRVPAVLRRIARCESGGNPRAVSSSGRYRGKYQFSSETWRSLGGQGDPAEAPEWLQDRMARKLYRQRGTAPWPNCG